LPQPVIFHDPLEVICRVLMILRNCELHIVSYPLCSNYT
jgi:hypothetical protein